MKIYSFSDAPIAHSYFTHIASQCLRGDILHGEWWNPQPTAAGHIFFSARCESVVPFARPRYGHRQQRRPGTDTPHGAVGHDTPPPAHVM
jgi:hypothetical protein